MNISVNSPQLILSQTDIKKLADNLSIYMMTININGTLNPYGQVVIPVSGTFPKPTSAWIGNFTGQDFFDIKWNVFAVSENEFKLYAASNSANSRSPNVSLNVFLTF